MMPMIPWWWTLISLIIGEIVWIAVVAFCSANEQEHDSKYIR